MSIDKEFKFLTKKLLSENREPGSRTWDPGSEIRGPGSEIRDPEKTYHESGSMGQKAPDPEYRIRICYIASDMCLYDITKSK